MDWLFCDILGWCETAHQASNSGYAAPEISFGVAWSAVVLVVLVLAIWIDKPSNGSSG